MRRARIAKVLSAADPDKLGGLKLQCEEVEGGAALGGGTFVPARVPFAGGGEGMWLPPPQGALVEIEFDEGDAVEDVALARWVGMLYSDLDQLPAEFRGDVENRGGIKFGADVLLFDRVQALLALISSNVQLGEEAASHPVVRGDVLNNALSALAGECATQWGAISAAATGALAPLAIPAAAIQAAWTTFQGKLATWLSTKVKTE